jgi:hypothetical protein
MNIPFYRYVEYLEDGHSLYQCLQCGTKIDVGEWFQPNFCWDCGIKFKGMMLKKQTDYISLPITTELWFQIQDAYDWGNEDGLNWSDNWRGCNNSHQAIKYLNDLKKERKRDNRFPENNKWKFRIITKQKEQHRQCVVINTKKYYQKTGKRFDPNEYKRT